MTATNQAIGTMALYKCVIIIIIIIIIIITSTFQFLFNWAMFLELLWVRLVPNLTFLFQQFFKCRVSEPIQW